MELETTIHSGGAWTVVSFTSIASAVQIKVGDKCLVLSRGGVLSDSCYRWGWSKEIKDMTKNVTKGIDRSQNLNAIRRK